MDKAMPKTDVEFSSFVSGLMFEGLISMGLVEHPSSGGLKKDLKHAEIVVNTLAMLKEKTSGNLTKEEADLIEEVLHQLRMGYVSAASGGESVEESKAGQETQEVPGGAEEEQQSPEGTA